MNFSQGHSETKVQCESCLFSWGKTPENSQKWAKFMKFSFWRFLVWFARATPEYGEGKKRMMGWWSRRRGRACRGGACKKRAMKGRATERGWRGGRGGREGGRHLRPVILRPVIRIFRSHPGKPNQRKASSWTFPGGIPEQKFDVNRACFPKEKHQNSHRNGRNSYELFVLALSLVWFAGATPEFSAFSPSFSDSYFPGEERQSAFSALSAFSPGAVRIAKCGKSDRPALSWPALGARERRGRGKEGRGRGKEGGEGGEKREGRRGGAPSGRMGREGREGREGGACTGKKQSGCGSRACSQTNHACFRLLHAPSSGLSLATDLAISVRFG